MLWKLYELCDLIIRCLLLTGKKRRSCHHITILQTHSHRKDPLNPIYRKKKKEKKVGDLLLTRTYDLVPWSSYIIHI